MPSDQRGMSRPDGKTVLSMAKSVQWIKRGLSLAVDYYKLIKKSRRKMSFVLFNKVEIVFYRFLL